MQDEVKDGMQDGTTRTGLTTRELATVLVALRFWQEYLESGDAIPERFKDHFYKTRPLSPHQIDDLCERLNCGKED